MSNRLTTALLAIAIVLQLHCTLIQGADDVIFTALSKKIIRPNSVHKLYISGEETGNPITVLVTVSSPNYTVVTQEAKIEPGSTREIKLEFKDLLEDSYNLTIKAVGGSKPEFEDRAVLYVNRKDRSILIQSDKPIYKPGETVRFRVILLDRQLRPLKENPQVNISISDPQRNLIKIWKNIEVANGLLSRELALSSEPNLGDWTIKVTSNEETTEQSFNVAQYVLPKFKVVVKLPNFATFNNSKIIAEIKALYTYGKAVNGEAIVTLSTFQYYYRQGEPQVIKIVPLNGSAFVEFDIAKDLNITDDYQREFEIKAAVTENVTGLQQNSSSKITLYKYPYKIALVNEPVSYKPGFPLNLTVKVSTQDDIPISDESPDAIQIAHGFSWTDEGGHINSSIPANGLVKLSFETPTNEYIFISNMQVKYKDLTQDLYLPSKVTNPSKTYMSLYLSSPNPKADENITIIAKANKPINSLKYVLLCRGLVHTFDKTASSDSTSKQQSINLEVPSACSPEGKVIAYATFGSNNEIVGDTVKFTVATVLDNFLNLTLSNQTVEPGKNISVTLESKPQSTIALRGVDQSVLLLKDDKDINQQSIENALQSFNGNSYEHRLYGGSQTHEVFDEAGLVVLTNGALDRPSPPKYRPHLSFNKRPVSSTGFAQAQLDTSTPMAELSFDSSRETNKAGGSSEVRIRKDFPETWIWEEVNSENGLSHLEKIVPDTITSWIISGFSISNTYGIGVGAPQTLTTFRPFFISLNLPYSVVKGEILALQVLVHNYLTTDITADITLDNSEGKFDYVEETGGVTNFTKKVSVKSSEVTSISFVILPKQFGIMNLNVKAVSQIAGDAVSRPLIVKPPGQKQVKNKAVLLDLRSGTAVEQKLAAEFPEKRVAGADTAKISVIGDLLGATASNLEKLLQLPTGCGEQNMLNFVVDIVILDYLKASGTLTPEIKDKALKFLESGYQRQLTYRRYDGSFSAFGNSDSLGSTWLTAFVVRSFLQAKPYISIDQNVIQGSLKFLTTQQRSTGGFQELGRILNSDLQGGSRSGDFAISAYTLLAFIEAVKTIDDENLKMNYTAVINSGIEYLRTTKTDDPYATNIIAYSLTVANHPSQNEFVKRMDSLAKSEGDLKFWEQNKTAALNTTESESPISIYKRYSTKPATVEMTAYALLTYILNNKVTESVPVARWLTQQRNAQGGFLSTQDTVVGITALAKFALATKSNDTDLQIVADHAGKSHTLKINKDNEIVLQEVFLDADIDPVTLKATGRGAALAQLSWTYYVENEATAPSFNIETKINPSSDPKQLNLNICSSFKSSDNSTSSNMAVMEVSLPSGYAFDTNSLDKVKKVPQVKRYETEDADTKLNLYFDSISSNQNCVDLESNLIHSVAKQVPAHIVLYDYYDTTRRASVAYDAPKISVCDICHGDPSCKIENC